MLVVPPEVVESSPTLEDREVDAVDEEDVRFHSRKSHLDDRAAVLMVERKL